MSMNQDVVFKKTKYSSVPAKFVMRKGNNTSFVKSSEDGSLLVAHDDQLTRRSSRTSVPPVRYGEPIPWATLRRGR